MRKKNPYTAARLIKEITDLCNHHKVDPKDITILFRRNRDCNPVTIHEVEEDLYNEHDNSTLETIMLINDSKNL
jgi:hypothetical protein